MLDHAFRTVGEKIYAWKAAMTKKGAVSNKMIQDYETNDQALQPTPF